MSLNLLLASFFTLIGVLTMIGLGLRLLSMKRSSAGTDHWHLKAKLKLKDRLVFFEK